MREHPLRERKPKRRIEEDPVARERTMARFPSPPGQKGFRDGYRECVQLFALHAPDKRGVFRTLDQHCLLLEQECLREGMERESIARYEGFKQAIKDIAAVVR